MIKLRYYQEEAVASSRFALRKINAALLVLATGAGKTVVFSFIARQTSEKQKRVLILAHRDTLLKQASNKLKDYGVEHGMITPAYTPQLHKFMQVASVQTLVRRLKKWKTAIDLLVIDEAHLSAAASYRKIIAHLQELNPAMKILGVTGSPARLDGKGLGVKAGGVYEEILLGITIKQLIEEGFLVEPDVYGPPASIDLSGVKMKGGEYEADSLAKAMDKPKITGDAIEHYRRICDGVPAVAWCANIKHAQNVAQQFTDAGIPARALCGEDDTAERDKALADLTAGKIKVITFAMLLVEGVDCPAIGAVIILRPTMSLSSYLQTVGRGLRPIFALGFDLETREGRFAAIDAGPKGRFCFVLDHAGLYKKHGFADDEREWSLDGVVKKKGAEKKKEEALPIQQCPKCFKLHPPAPACPKCKHVYEAKGASPEVADGELVRITKEEKAAAQKLRSIEVKRAATLAELVAIGQQRGYSENWATHVFTAKERKRASKASGGIRRPEPPIEAYMDLFNDRSRSF